MFVYLPEACQQAVTATNNALPAVDMENININSATKLKITQSKDSYCHDFNLKKCSDRLWDGEQQVYALRTMTGNPLTLTRSSIVSYASVNRF
jgi:hypothetical protein